MKIELGKRDYRALLTVLEIAGAVLHTYRDEDAPETAPLRALQQKLLALAEPFGCGELVEYDPDSDLWLFSGDAGDTSDALQFLEEFESDSFWDQLCDRLVERDLLRQLGEAACRRLDPEELDEREQPYRTLYADEFMRHGIDRLEILPGVADAGGARSRLS